MADVIDQAQAAEELYREKALKGALKRSKDQSAEACVRCGGTIPEARRVAVPGVRLCISCQEDAEA